MALSTSLPRNYALAGLLGGLPEGLAEGCVAVTCRHAGRYVSVRMPRCIPYTLGTRAIGSTPEVCVPKSGQMPRGMFTGVQ
jgi:hypothetical protein